MPRVVTPLVWFLLAQVSIVAAGPYPGSPGPGPATASARPAGSTKFVDTLCNTQHPDITPLDQPAINYPKKATLRPQQYLEKRAGVVDKLAAQWQEAFFGSAKQATLKPQAQVKPIQDRPTIVSFYYPHPNPRYFKNKASYFERIRRLAATKEQVVIYVAQEIAAEIRSFRSDPGWHVIDDYPTIWDVPNNKVRGRKENFEGKQRQIFADMLATGTRDWQPSRLYDDAFYSAAYNAKAFITFDAPLRNPFGSTRWVYLDGGLLQIGDPKIPSLPVAPTKYGKPWDMLFGGFLDNAKVDRLLRLTKNSGVVFPEYAEDHGVIDINSRAFNDPLYQWQSIFYLGGIFVGNTLGMLNYAVRYMQTVDTLDANNRYIGREEFITPITAAMYPNTVFSQPVQRLPKELNDPKFGSPTLIGWQYMLLSLSNYGKTMLPEVRDPIAGRYCRRGTAYQARGRLYAGKP